ncbi:S-adenosyl-L-methionine-dependent methyltransferase [Hypoxylon argillaceum]|nr:S-adenosyl-L-methionine-dependent methyltransferase [Hypoxylon argillaceum]
MVDSRILDLSARIAANSAKLNAYLHAHQLPNPSFSVDAPCDSLVPKSEKDVEAARVAIIEDTLELRSLALGPREYVMSFSHNDLLSLQAITRFKLAQLFPVGAEITFPELAERCRLSEPTVRQIVRHAIMLNVFCEPRPGVVAHNAVSRLLAEDDSTFGWLAANTNELWKAAAHQCDAWEKYPQSDEPNQSGFSLANQTEKSIYEVFDEYPDRAKRFGDAMRSFTQGTGFELRHVTDNVPWADFQNGTVVDVGGSQGHVAMAVARAFPSLSFVVQDFDTVVTPAEKSVPTDLADRVKFMAYDFFTEQPVREADVYYFRWIFHNWSDKYCVKILKNLIPALKPGAKIIINDGVLPMPGMLSRWQEKKLRAIDLTMTEMQNARERELGDWKNLLRMADSRFEFQDAKKPEGSTLWLITVEWKG